MSKSRILTIIAIVIAVAVLVIIGILIFNNKSNNTKDTYRISIDNSSINVQPDTFKGKVISIDLNKAVVIANEDSAISQANGNVRIIDVVFDTNTQVLQAGEIKSTSVIEVDKEITISYDGIIISTNPITICASKIEL